MSSQSAPHQSKAQYQEQAREKLKALSLPNRSEESWRKVDLGIWQGTSFHTAESNVESTLGAHDPFVRRLPLDEALHDPHVGDAAVRFLLQPETLTPNGGGTSYFDLLRRSLQNGGMCIHISGSSSKPVRIEHRLISGDTLAPLTLIVVDRGVDVVIVEEIHGKASEPFTQFLPETMLVAGEGAQVRYTSLRRYAGSEFHFQRITTEQGRDSSVHAAVVQLGGFAGKGFFTARLLAPGAEFRALGIAVGAGAEFQDIEFLVEHKADHTTSRILYKTVLRDRAHSVFDGNVDVPPGTKGVDAHQVNHNIILNKKARAESMPRLIIKSHEVRSEHGATVGELDPEALFFLMSRGIPENEARSLLIDGFVAEVVEKIGLPPEIGDLLEEIRSRISS